MRSTWNLGRPSAPRQWSATTWIVASLVGFFLLGWFFSGSRPNPVWENLAYSENLSKPWTLLTYPFANPFQSVFWFAIGCWVLYQFMSDLERRLGVWGVTLFFFSMTVLGGIGYAVGSAVAGQPSMIPPSLYLPLEVVVFTWAMLNWTATVKLFFCIPVPCSVLAYLCLAAVVITHGWGTPLVGVFTALPVLVAWLYVTNRISFMPFGHVPSMADARVKKKDTAEFHTYIDKVRERETERKERERLRALFEDSLEDDDKSDD